MLFSCKITHSVITYLDRRGDDLEVLYEKCDWPSEFLRDPSSWLEADKMEGLLRLIEQEFGADPNSEEQLISAVGHQCKDLRSWGVLDSVLRMVQAPKDLFAQPERFLSYFVSPAPPVGDVKREANSVGFVLPVSEVQFPYVTSYLRAALEALPTYIAKPMAGVTWENSRVTITWSEDQVSLFGEADATDLSLNPELVRSILASLESSQKQLDEMKRTLLLRDQEIEKLKSESKTAINRVSDTETRQPSFDLSPVFIDELGQGALANALHDLYRLGDYIARGQQLITLLIGQGRQTPQVQEAMRRVDWEFVSIEGPSVVRRVVSELQKIQENSRSFSAENSKANSVANSLMGVSAKPSPLDL